MAAGGSAEDAELMLQTDHVYVAYVEEIGCAQIGRKVLLLDLEANHLRVFIAVLDVVNGYRETLALRVRGRNGAQQIGGECGDAAFAGQVVANESNFKNFRTVLQM